MTCFFLTHGVCLCLLSLPISVYVSFSVSACLSVCAGVGSFTIVDGQTVTGDDAGNKLVIVITVMMIMTVFTGH